MAVPLDPYGFAFTAILTVVIQLSFFAIANGFKFDLVTDFAGSTNFIVSAVAVLLLAGNATSARPLILTALLTITRLELALFLLYRVLKRKKDVRFDQMRNNCASFFAFWVFQMLWVWFVSLPVVFVNAAPPSDSLPAIGPLDILGWVVFAVGFVVQLVADLQKFNFRSKPENKGIFCNVGVWGCSRHPNYFGEFAIWWGIWIAALPVIMVSDNPLAAWATILSPLWTMLILLFVSGLPTSEGKSLARLYQDETTGQQWEVYRRRTSPIVPLPPALYERLPLLVKRIFFFEFPFLEYDPAVAAAAAAAEGGGLSAPMVGAAA